MKPLFKKGQTVITSKGNIGVIDEDQVYNFDDNYEHQTSLAEITEEGIAYYTSHNITVTRSIPLVKLGNKVYQINEDKLELTNGKEDQLILLINSMIEVIDNTVGMESWYFKKQLDNILNQ